MYPAIWIVSHRIGIKQERNFSPTNIHLDHAMSDPLPGFMPGKNCEKKQNKSRIVPSSMKRSSNDGCLQKKANVLIVYYPRRRGFFGKKINQA